MRTVCVTVLAVLLIVTGGCCIAAVKKKSEYSGVLLRLLGSGMIAMAGYIGFLLSHSLTWALLFDGIYFSCTDWLLVFMLLYVCRYAEVKLRMRFLRVVIFGCASADTVSLLLNVRMGHMFRLTEAVHTGMEMSYWSTDFLMPHYWHLGFCYFLTALIFLLLIVKSATTSWMYRKMYLYIMLPLAVVLLVNAVCYSNDFPVDFSLFLYAGLAICICYGSLYAAPKGLLEDTLVNVVKDFKSGIFCLDIRGRCIYANARAWEFMGSGAAEDRFVFERFYKNWRDKHPGISRDYEQWEESCGKGETERIFSMEYQRVKDKKNATLGYSFRMTDRTEEIRRFREEQFLATHDRLTGLYNREYFFQKAEQILQRKPEVQRYMVCTNIRNFKLVNDLFGEEMGDRVLVDQASILKFANYEDCIQGRIEADKFAMLIAEEHFSDEFATKNLSRLQYLINDGNYKVHVVVGVYRIEDSTESPQVMYDRANMAIQSLQGDYRKTVVYYDTKMLKQLVYEKSIVSEFDHAIDSGQFQMYLQPLVRADGTVKGAEALARWKHPAQGLIQPVNFISVVEKTGLIIRLDEYMWEQAARKLKEWKNIGRENMTISVNISARDFYYADLYKAFTELTDRYGISPSNLNIEITETALMSDVDRHMETLTKLHERGFIIELDDFGSGYSSLNMLKDITADILKIDMLFLRQTEHEGRSRVILQSVISMAKQLGMDVIAEGVETLEQLEELKSMQCELFQGFYFSKPITAEEFDWKYVKDAAQQEKAIQ